MTAKLMVRLAPPDETVCVLHSFDAAPDVEARGVNVVAEIDFG